MPPPGNHKPGFTLLEVLISISIFALVVSSVYGAYRATFQTVNNTESQVTLAAAARIILERVSEDLEALSTDEDGYLLGKRGDIQGMRADSLSCMSFTHLVFNRNERQGGRAALSYSIEEAEGGLFDLYRSDVPVRPGSTTGSEQDKGELLGRGLQQFRVTYVAADGTEYEDWDSEETTVENENGEAKVKIKLPVLVRLEIRFADSAEDTNATVYRTAVALPALPVDGSEG